MARIHKGEAMRKVAFKKLELHRETLQELTHPEAGAAVGATGITNCSVCVSCEAGTSCTC